MRALLALSLLCLPLLAAAQVGASSPKLVALAPARLVFKVDPRGRVSGIRCDPALAQAMCASIRASMPRWKFAPATSKGKPIATLANINLDMIGTPGTRKLNLHAVRVQLEPGSNSFPRRVAPGYPPEQERRHVTARVEIELLKTTGAKFDIGRTWVDGRPAARSNVFVNSAVGAVQQWRHDWDPRQRSACVTIEFLFEPWNANTAPEACYPGYTADFRPPRLLTSPKSMLFP